jgi:hypothetical protein
MTFGVHKSHQHGNMDISLYAPFWMVNKTGLHLTYRVSCTHAQITSWFLGALLAVELLVLGFEIDEHVCFLLLLLLLIIC